MNVHNGKVDIQLQKQLKKHSNYCNNLIKKAVREQNGKNITNENDVSQIWNCINDILRPENITKNSIKIETEGKLIEDSLELAEEFNKFLLRS